MKNTYTRDEVVSIIDTILQMPDTVIDAMQNENTNTDAEDLLKMAEESKQISIAMESERRHPNI